MYIMLHWFILPLSGNLTLNIRKVLIFYDIASKEEFKIKVLIYIVICYQWFFCVNKLHHLSLLTQNFIRIEAYFILLIYMYSCVPRLTHSCLLTINVIFLHHFLSYVCFIYCLFGRNLIQKYFMWLSSISGYKLRPDLSKSIKNWVFCG